MKTLVLSFSAILASLAPADTFKSAAQITKINNPPIVGLWQLEIPGYQGCIEKYNFQSDKKLSVVSGVEWTYGRYDFIYKPGKKLPILVMHTIYDDNNVDCSVIKKDQSGEQFVSYFKRESDVRFHLCNDDTGTNCALTFNRVLPY